MEKYALLPANVRYDKELNPHAKLLYGDILTLCDAEGYCLTSNDYFTQLYNVSTTIVITWLNQLKAKNLIKIVGKENIVDKLKSLNLNGIGFGQCQCEWCGINTPILQKHHYPIPKSKGGTKTVNICSNCHAIYHWAIGLQVININDVLETIKYNKENK